MLLGAYFLAVVYHGNAEEFVDGIGADKSFLLWLMAAAILIYGGKMIGGDAGARIGLALLGVAFLAFLIQSGENAAKTLDQIVTKLQS